MSQFLWYVVVLLNTYVGNLKLNLSFLLIASVKFSQAIWWAFIDLRPIYVNARFVYYPTELLIGYNNIHPLLLYVSYVWIFFRIGAKEFFFIFKWLTILTITVVVLLLGGYWGLNNAVWGFFWVNDLIEWILVCLISAVLFIIHNKKQRNQLIRVFLWMFLLTFILYLSRYGLVFTRHNFFNVRNTANFSLSIFLLLGVSYLALFLLVGLTLAFGLNVSFSAISVWLLARSVIRWQRLWLWFFHIFILTAAIHWLCHTPLNFSEVYHEVATLTIWKIINTTSCVGGLLLNKMFFGFQQLYTTVTGSIKILAWRNIVIPTLAMTCFYVITLISLMKIYNSFEQKFV